MSKKLDWKKIITERLSKVFTSNSLVQSGVRKVFEDTYGGRKDALNGYNILSKKGADLKNLSDFQFLAAFERSNLDDKAFIYAIYKGILPINPLSFLDSKGKSIPLEKLPNLYISGTPSGLKYELKSPWNTKDKSIPINLQKIKPPNKRDIWKDLRTDKLIKEGIKAEEKAILGSESKSAAVSGQIGVSEGEFYKFVSSGEFVKLMTVFYMPIEGPKKPPIDDCNTLCKYLYDLESGFDIDELQFLKDLNECGYPNLFDVCGINDSSRAQNLAFLIYDNLSDEATDDEREIGFIWLTSKISKGGFEDGRGKF